jgi:hypothetical protein
MEARQPADLLRAGVGQPPHVAALFGRADHLLCLPDAARIVDDDRRASCGTSGLLCRPPLITFDIAGGQPSSA